MFCTIFFQGIELFIEFDLVDASEFKIFGLTELPHYQLFGKLCFYFPNSHPLFVVDDASVDF